LPIFDGNAGLRAYALALEEGDAAGWPRRAQAPSLPTGPWPAPRRQPAEAVRPSWTKSLAAASASGTVSPEASRAAVAAAKVQPVPWSLPVATRGRRSSVTAPVAAS